MIASLLAADPGRLRAHELRAPALLPSEVTSALCEMAFRGDIPADEAIAAVDRLAAATIIYEPPGGDARDEIDLARRLGWATSYDAESVALCITTRLRPRDPGRPPASRRGAFDLGPRARRPLRAPSRGPQQLPIR